MLEIKKRRRDPLKGFDLLVRAVGHHCTVFGEAVKDRPGVFKFYLSAENWYKSVIPLHCD